MSKHQYTETEQQINNVLKYQDEELKGIKFPDKSGIESRLSNSEDLLRSLGYTLPEKKNVPAPFPERNVMMIPSWESLLQEAERHVCTGCELESIFTEEELKSNELAVEQLNAEFNGIHKLDKTDIAISSIAGIVGATVDILMVGMPQKGPDGLEAGPLSEHIRAYFDRKFPEAEMQKLANSKVSKVPFDAQDNRNTTVYVDGLSAYYHRMLQLGHDPILGFLFGVADILTGRMTTIDKSGKIVCQVMENYADRKESDIFLALAKQITHFKSDVTTSMGLPAPFMSLFNLLQFGKIGEYEQAIAEIVQGMYYEGYDFIHFCSMSVPSMLVEVIIRLGYAFKRIGEGHSVKESIPVSLSREKNPKLATMLFLGHSTATAANAGKVAFSKNPMAINYPQWIAFTKYSYAQLKWALIEKPELRNEYVMGKIYDDYNAVYAQIDSTFEAFTEKYIVVIE